MDQFTTWSYSALDTYRLCPLRAKFRYIDKLPDPGNKYSQRGNEIHDQLEGVVKRGEPVPDVAVHFAPLLEQMQQTDTICEKMFMFDGNWQPTDDRSRVWLYVKQDLVVVGDEYVLTVDYKTGKKFGNEVKHMAQKTLYSIAAKQLWPGREEYIAEMWYIDQKDLTSRSFTPAFLDQARARLDAEVEKMFADRTFRPRPNIQSCKYCPYGPRGSGHCPVGV